MKLTTKARYAVMAMVDLAASTDGAPVALASIAGRQEISLSYLEQLFARLRRAGLVVDLGFRGNLGRRMKRADRLNARAALILGEDELAKGTITLRDLDSGEQSEVPVDQVEARLRQLDGSRGE